MSESFYTEKTRRWALVAVVALSFFAAAVVAGPLWIPIVLGFVMAISAHRPYLLLCHTLEGKKKVIGPRTRSSWAAAIITIITGLLLAVAGSAILLAITNELINVVAHLNQKSQSLEGLIGVRATHAIGQLGVDTAHLFNWAQRQIEAAASFAATTAAVVVRTTSEALLGLVVSLLTMYYVLLEGPSLAVRIESIAPLEPRHTRALLIEAREVSRSAFIGTIATAIVQGVLAGIGYAILGVPQPVLWGAITGVASFLPVIGTFLVWGPIAGYLALEGHPIRALILLVWGILLITSLADYVIRPRIVGGRGRQAHGHPLLTLIALLGGIEVFGLAGLIIAPIVMSVFVAAFRIYERELKARVPPAIKDDTKAPAAAAAVVVAVVDERTPTAAATHRPILAE